MEPTLLILFYHKEKLILRNHKIVGLKQILARLKCFYKLLRACGCFLSFFCSSIDGTFHSTNIKINEVIWKSLSVGLVFYFEKFFKLCVWSRICDYIFVTTNFCYQKRKGIAFENVVYDNIVLKIIFFCWTHPLKKYYCTSHKKVRHDL